MTVSAKTDCGTMHTQVTFGLSRRYGIHIAREAHAWFLSMVQEHDEFEVETDKAEELPSPSSMAKPLKYSSTY